MRMQRLKALGLSTFMLLSLLGCSTASPPPDQPTAAPSPAATTIRTEQLPGKLALGREGAIWIWQDRQLRQIIPPPATQPVFSPDGLTLAYVERSAGASDVVLADAEGNQLGRLTEHGSTLPETSLDRVYETAWAFYPSWSPLGDRLIVAMQARPPAGDPPRDFPLALFELSPMGDRRSLSEGDGLDYSRSVMASNGIIYATAVSREKDAQQTLYAFDTAGIGTPLIAAPVPAFDPTLTHDERYLIFAATIDGATDIFSIDLLSGAATPTQLTSFGTARSPAVSPDGSKLAFLAIAEGGKGFDLFVADFGVDDAGMLRAGEPRRLSTELGLDPDAGLSWAP